MKAGCSPAFVLSGSRFRPPIQFTRRAYSSLRRFRGGTMSLKGKHALITGSSRGIGRGIALKLAEQGAKIGVHYFQNEKAAKDTLAEVRKRGSDGITLQGDVTRVEEVESIFARV